MYPNTVNLIVTLLNGLGYTNIAAFPAMISQGTWLIECDYITIVIHLAGSTNGRGQIRINDEIEFDSPIQK